jgi:hypothetical protein
MTINRPDASEFANFYAGYVGKVPDSGPVKMLEEQIGRLEKLKSLPEDKANRRGARLHLPPDADCPRRSDAARRLRRERVGEDGSACQARDVEGGR